jgi:hypothetical protein
VSRVSVRFRCDSYDLPYEHEGVLYRHVQEARWDTPVQATCMSVKKDILLSVSTRNTAKSPDKDLVVGGYAHPGGLRF